MAIEKGATTGTTTTPETTTQPQKIGGYIEKIADWIVEIISFPVNFVGHILASFITPGSSGTKALGALGFFAGTFLSADGIWQTLFQGTPLFPFFESSWIGWIGWLQVIFNPLFWLAVGMSALIQVMEARSLRGKTPNQAKTELEESRQYTLGSKPTGAIDLTQALWGDYKRAGMKERHAGGAIALFFWILDITTTFVGRNPWGYSNDAGEIFACFLYNLATMMSGEIGFNIWKLTRK